MSGASEAAATPGEFGLYAPGESMGSGALYSTATIGAGVSGVLGVAGAAEAAGTAGVRRGIGGRGDNCRRGWYAYGIMCAGTPSKDGGAAEPRAADAPGVVGVFEVATMIAGCAGILSAAEADAVASDAGEAALTRVEGGVVTTGSEEDVFFSGDDLSSAEADSAGNSAGGEDALG